jgi:hypothetical protein
LLKINRNVESWRSKNGHAMNIPGKDGYKLYR